MTNNRNYLSRDNFPGGYAIYIMDLEGCTLGNVKLEARFTIALQKSAILLIHASFLHTKKIDDVLKY